MTEQEKEQKRKIYENAYASSWNNCSGFLKDVAEKMDVNDIPDSIADGIVGYLDKNWDRIPNGKLAVKLASKGVFVIAGSKSNEIGPGVTHGHVAIVVEGTLYLGKYPLVWAGGGQGGRSKGKKSVGETWPKATRDTVRYFAPRGTLQKMKKEMEEANGKP